MTAAAERFVTPLAAAALSGDKVYTDLFSLTDESEMGHLRLAQEADLHPRRAGDRGSPGQHGGRPRRRSRGDRAARQRQAGAGGAGNEYADVAASGDPRQFGALEARGVQTVGPNAGAARRGRERHPPHGGARGDRRRGRGALGAGARRLAGRKALVTSGPTHEPIDPVRYLANRSSGKQGHAIAAALARSAPRRCWSRVRRRARSARRHRRPRRHRARDAGRLRGGAAGRCCGLRRGGRRLAPRGGGAKAETEGCAAALKLVENPDILATLRAPETAAAPGHRLCRGDREPDRERAAKRAKKGCDWIIANDVSAAPAPSAAIGIPSI